MTKFIFSILILFLALDSYSQENKNITFTKVILSSQTNTLKNNDTTNAPGYIMLSISLDSDTHQLIEAEYSVILKRGKSHISSISGKGKEISLFNIASSSQSRDMVVIEIKKLKISTPGIVAKPSNGLFRIYLK